MASSLSFSFSTPSKAVMEFTAGSTNANAAYSEDISKSDLVNIRLYSYEWTVNNYSMIKSVCDESSGVVGPSFPVAPLKNMELHPVLLRNGDNLKIEFQLMEIVKETATMKNSEVNCLLTDNIFFKNNLNLEFIDSCGKTIDFYLSLPSDVKFVNGKRIISWTKEGNVSRFIFGDSLAIRANLSFRYYSKKAAVTELSNVESIKIFQNDMKNLFNDRTRFPDYLIKVGGQFVVAHKAILFTQYPRFAEFANSNIESKILHQDPSKPSKLPTNFGNILENDFDILCIPNEKVDVFLSVLHFIYCRKLHTDVSVNDFAVYKFAEKYGIKELSMLLIPSEIRVHSEIEFQKVIYKWHVRNFSSNKNSFALHEISPTFQCGNDGRTTWCVGIFRLDSENIVLNLQRHSDLDLDIQATFKLAVCKTDGSIHDEKEYRHLFTASTISNCHPQLMNSVPRILITPELLHNDTLTIRCDLSVSTGRILSRQNYLFPSDYPTIDVTYWQSNFKNLLQKKSFADVTLLVDDKEFKVHKAILSARSPVFCKMFESDMEEKISGCVRIEDISEIVIQKMLYYMYSAEFPDLTMEQAPELYRTADKYEIMDLKIRCSEFILQELNVKNACEVLILADLYDDTKLKQAAKKLICKNSAQTLLSSSGIELITNNYPLARDILESLSAAFCALPPQDTFQIISINASKLEMREAGARLIAKPKPVTNDRPPRTAFAFVKNPFIA